MSLSLYDVTVSGFLQTVDAIEAVLHKGLAHCRSADLDPASLVEARLHPDMLPLRFQVVSIVKHSVGAIECVKAGLFGRPPEVPPLDYAQLQATLADAQATLRAYTRDEIDALAQRELRFQPGELHLQFTAVDFLLSFSIPNFHFHATTAYDILRSKGVPIGKRDYLGRMRVKT